MIPKNFKTFQKIPNDSEPIKKLEEPLERQKSLIWEIDKEKKVSSRACRTDPEG